MREAINCLAKYNLSTATAVAMYRHYGPDTVDVIARDPYVPVSYTHLWQFGQSVIE